MALQKNYGIKLYIESDAVKVTDISFYQGDEKSGYLDIELFLNNQVPYNITDAESAEITFKKSDGNVAVSATTDTTPRLVISDATNGKLTYQIGTQDIAYAGTVECTVSLLDTDGLRLTSSKFTFIVNEPLDTDGQATTSTSENSYNQRITDLENTTFARYETEGTFLEKQTFNKGIKTNSIKSLGDEVELEIITSGDKKGLSVLGGNLSVGSMDKPFNFRSGTGKNVDMDSVFHYQVGNEVGTVITGATDISTEMSSENDSALPMFASNVAGEILLTGSDYPWYGMYVKYDTIGSVEPENISGDYYTENDEWLPEDYMITNANYPHEQAGWEISSFDEENFRYGTNPINPLITDFGLMTLNINGEDITKYWSRFQLTAPVTTMPIMEQIQQHANLTKISDYGVTELFGLARSSKTLLSGIRTVVPNLASDPNDESVTYFTGGLNGAIAKYTDNEFADNAIDSTLLVIPFEEGLDTSMALLIGLSYYVKSAGETGDVEIIAEYQQVIDDFIYNSVTDPEGTIKTIDNITESSQYVRKTMTFTVPINKVGTNGGGVLIVLSRDARVSNGNDTLSSAIVLTNISVRGTKWRL